MSRFSRKNSFARNLMSLDSEMGELYLDGGNTATQRNQWYFEVAWETVNKGLLIYVLI